MTIENKYLDVLENLGWVASDVNEDNSFALKKYSPAGEDYCFAAYTDTIVEDVGNEAEYFDIDEHVMIWADRRGYNGVPDTIRELLDDAEAIKAMLNELADALENVQGN